MKYNIENYKDDIVFINIDNERNLKATLSNCGAGIYSLKINDKLVCLELKNKDEYLTNAQYFGKTLGRVAGRILLDGEIDNKTYHLKPTNNYNYSLHGGDLKSISFKNWKYSIKEFKNKLQVIFSINDRKNANGFIGDAKIKVIYEIYQNNDNFKIIFKGKTSEATLLNLSNHIYFNLFNSIDVSDYYLKINASKVSIHDKDLLITGYEDVPNQLDFKKSSKLGPKMTYLEKKSIIGTIDNTWLFDEITTKKPQCILKNKDITVSLYTSYPAMNIYLDNSKIEREFNNKENLLNRRGIALEPQLNDFDLESIKLRKNEKYEHFILYKFKF